MDEWLQHADDVLNNAVAGIAEIINVAGHDQRRLQDVKTIMGEQGKAMMGTATACRRRSRAHRRRAGRCYPAAGRHRPVRRARRAGEHHVEPFAASV